MGSIAVYRVCEQEESLNDLFGFGESAGGTGVSFEKVEIGNATLYCGDCRDVLPTLPDESVDIMLTDPPYGHNNNDDDLISRREAALGKAPSRIDNSAPRPILNDGMDDMKAVVDAALTHAERLLRHYSCCCFCCGGGGPKPTFAWLANRMDTGGLQFFHAVVWDKAQIDDHPTPKPVALFDHFLSLHGKPGDIVLDPFMGHAPVGVAAVSAGMHYIGIELDHGHFAAACRRIENVQRQSRLFETEAATSPIMKQDALI